MLIYPLSVILSILFILSDPNLNRSVKLKKEKKIMGKFIELG